MAIAFDSAGSAAVSGTVLSYSHTINSQNNSIIFGIFTSIASGGTVKATPTFAGSAMTKIIAGTNVNDILESEIWYLLNPPSGINTLVGTFSASNDCYLIGAAYTGVNQITPIAGSFSSVGTSKTAGTVTDTTLGANNWFVGGIIPRTSPGTTSTGNQRGTITLASIETMWADSTGGTLLWTHPSASDISLGVEIGTAAVSTPINKTFKSLLGVGNI